MSPLSSEQSEAIARFAAGCDEKALIAGRKLADVFRGNLPDLDDTTIAAVVCEVVPVVEVYRDVAGCRSLAAVADLLNGMTVELTALSREAL